jgi:hypothetical protein
MARQKLEWRGCLSRCFSQYKSRRISSKVCGLDAQNGNLVCITSTDRLNAGVEHKDGSLSHTTSKRCLNGTTRHRVRYGAGSPSSDLLRIRHPAICPRSCAYYCQSCFRRLITFIAVKAGYPPRPLTAVIPELPLTSLGLAPGDQLIVNQKSGSAAPPGVTSSTAQSLPTNSRAVVNPPAPVPTLSSNAAQVAPGFSETGKGGPDYVEIDGGYLVHRVRVTHACLIPRDGIPTEGVACFTDCAG